MCGVGRGRHGPPVRATDRAGEETRGPGRMKAIAIALLGHRDDNVRCLARGLVTGKTTNRYYLSDALMDAGEQFGDLMRFEVGQQYYIETLTKYYVGKVVSCDGCELVLESAAWVASTGLMTDFMAKGKSQNLEVEIIGEIGIPIGMITAKSPWPHKLWKEPLR